jgi:hypothetical protein
MKQEEEEDHTCFIVSGTGTHTHNDYLPLSLFVFPLSVRKRQVVALPVIAGRV